VHLLQQQLSPGDWVSTRASSKYSATTNPATIISFHETGAHSCEWANRNARTHLSLTYHKSASTFSSALSNADYDCKWCRDTYNNHDWAHFWWQAFHLRSQSYVCSHSNSDRAIARSFRLLDSTSGQNISNVLPPFCRKLSIRSDSRYRPPVYRANSQSNQLWWQRMLHLSRKVRRPTSDSATTMWSLLRQELHKKMASGSQQMPSMQTWTTIEGLQCTNLTKLPRRSECVRPVPYDVLSRISVIT